MSKQQKVQMPQGTAGLIRYFDSEKEAIKMKPEHVIVICVGLIVVVMLLRAGLFV